MVPFFDFFSISNVGYGILGEHSLEKCGLKRVSITLFLFTALVSNSMGNCDEFQLLLCACRVHKHPDVLLCTAKRAKDG